MLDLEVYLIGAIQKVFHLQNVRVINFLSNSPPLMSFTKMREIIILTAVQTDSYTNARLLASSNGKEEKIPTV